MATQQRRPAPGKAGYGVSKQQAEEIKKHNETSVYIQGFRSILNASGITPVQIALNAPGKKLLGFSIIPGSGNNSDIADCQFTAVVNNNNIVLNGAANNANPGFVNANQFFLPTPQKLTGNDTITVNIQKNSGVGTPTVYVNAFYIPQ